MKQRLALTLVTALVLFAGVKTALASEGTAILDSPDTGAQCFLASVLVSEKKYQLVMTCRQLVVPPETETLFYHAWAKRAGIEAQEGESRPLASLGRGAFISLGDITGGKLTGSTRDPFDEILVTAEAVSRPREPNLDRIIISGSVQPISFEGAAPKLSPTPAEKITATPTLAPTPKGEGRRIAGTAFRVFLGILVVIVIFAIVISLLQRRSAKR